MEDDKKDPEETPNRGNEWEVVSLTASAYDAAPGPGGVNSTDDGKQDAGIDDETSRALFMSGHFVFPPSQHENLPLEPLEPSNEEIMNEPVGDSLEPKQLSGLFGQEENRSGKNNEENWSIEGIREPDEMHASQFFDGKGKNLLVHDSQFEAAKALQGLHMDEEEKSIYAASKFSSFDGEADISGPNASDETSFIPESTTPESNSLSDYSNSPIPSKDNSHEGPGLPCEAWWKRHAASLYAQAKEANAFWSVFVAAALMGLVILGQRWQREKWQAQQIKLHYNINEELVIVPVEAEELEKKMNWMMGSLSRFKDVIVGGQRRGSIIRASSASAEH